MVARVKGNMTQTKYIHLRDCIKIIWVLNVQGSLLAKDKTVKSLFRLV